MIDTDWTTRKLKHSARRVVLSGAPRHSVLLMPSNGLKDYELGVDNKVITPKTNVIFVERRQDIGGLLADFSPRVGYRKPDVIVNDLCKTQLPYSVDLAWVDLCGNLVAEDVSWIQRELFSKLLPNSLVAFTFSARYRHNKFIEEKLASIEDDYLKEVSKTMPVNMPKEIVPMAATHIQLLNEIFSGWMWEDQCYYREGKKSPSMFLYVLSNSEFVFSKETAMKTASRPKRLSPQQWAWHPSNPNGIRAKKLIQSGKRPECLSPQQWAWHPSNPNGIRAKK